MSEEQLKAAEIEATAQVEDAVEGISEEDLDGVAGGINRLFPSSPGEPSTPDITCCGHDPCLGPLTGCNTETTAD